MFVLNEVSDLRRNISSDQMKFFRIESLMGIEVTKMPIPEALGKGPEYNPEANKNQDKKRSFGGGGGKGGGKGKSNFKPRTNNGPRK